MERLKYAARRGKVKKLARGLYASVPPGVDPKKFQPDRFLAAAALLRPLAGLWPEPTSKGLLVLGPSELPLDVAAKLLHAVLGDVVCPGPRRVCYLRQPRMQPIMDVFVRVPSIYTEAVVTDLRRRGALVRVSTVNQSGWLVRAEAPMAALLGYAKALASETLGSADHWITFNRWEPLEPLHLYVNGAPAQAFQMPARA